MLKPTRPSEHKIGVNIVLRRYQDVDTPGLLALVQRNYHRLVSSFPGLTQQVTSASTAAKYVRARRREWDQHQAFFWAVFAKSDRTQIGQVRFRHVDWMNERSEIAYFIDEAYEGAGAMTSALACLLEVGFEDLNLNKVFARVAPSNERSIQLLQKLGFQKEGLLRRDIRTQDGLLADVLYFGILRDDFAKARLNAIERNPSPLTHY